MRFHSCRACILAGWNAALVWRLYWPSASSMLTDILMDPLVTRIRTEGELRS